MPTYQRPLIPQAPELLDCTSELFYIDDLKPPSPRASARFDRYFCVVVVDSMGKDTEKSNEPSDATAAALEGAHDGDIINVSGHKQELDRIFNPLSCISLAVACGNVWPALAGSIVSMSVLDIDQS